MLLSDLKRKLYSFGGLRKGGDSGGSSNTTIQRADPWAGQQEYLTYGFGQAKDQYLNQIPQYYPGQITAPVDPLTQLAQSQLGAQTPTMERFGNQAVTSATFDLGAGRDPQTNPYLQSAIQAALDPMVRDFNSAGGTLAGIRGEAIQNAQLGGSRQGIAEGIALDSLQRNMVGAAAQMANQGYQKGQDTALRTLALAPQTMGLLSTPATTLDAIGAQRQGYQQQLINDAIQQWNFQQNLPSAKLAQYMNLVQGNWGGTSSATSTGTSGYRRDPFTGALGGAMAGWQLSGGSPWGAGIGALLSFL